MQDLKHEEILAEVLVQANPEAARDVLSHADFNGLKLLNDVHNALAGQLLIQLAHAPTAASEKLINATIEAYSGAVWDREKPFEILSEHAVYQNLSPELQGKIQDLIAFW